MRNLKIISFSQRGYELGCKLKRLFEEQGDSVRLAVKCREHPQAMGISLKEWCRDGFEKADGLIFIGACGIAVRIIAPFIRSKTEDPAVVVMDEGGSFAIALLSGHLGGANELAQEAAGMCGAQPVITTATDVNHKFAVDVFARKNQCYISDMRLAKEISAALLAGKEVGFASSFPIEGQLPQELKLCQVEENTESGCPELGILVSPSFLAHPFVHTLTLVPKVVTVGIGCKRGKPKEDVENAVRKACNQLLVPSAAMANVASIDLKADEEGILGYCRERDLPFITYPKEELEKMPGEFTPSVFVEKTTGVNNVCERSALKASGQGTLILKKRVEHGVTVALAVKKWSVKFE